MIYFIIIIVLLILLWYYNTYESFDDLEDDLFLSKNDIIDFINNDYDKYFYNLSFADLSARNVKNISDYKNIIINNIYQLSKKQKNRLTILFNNANNLLYKKYIDIAHIKCKIVLIKNNIYDNGLSHTRSNIIFLSSNILNDSNYKIIQTLIHEKVHIFQRYNPYHKYIIDFLDNNGIKRFMKRDEYIKTYPLLRSNPDLDNWIYIDKSNALSCSYNNRTPQSISDVNCNQINEHPFEMMAYNIVNSLHS